MQWLKSDSYYSFSQFIDIFIQRCIQLFEFYMKIEEVASRNIPMESTYILIEDMIMIGEWTWDRKNKISSYENNCISIRSFHSMLRNQRNSSFCFAIGQIKQCRNKK